MTVSALTRKTRLRSAAYAARQAQQHKPALSRSIGARLLALTAYRQARTVMWYLHCRSEVQTQALVAEQLGSDKTIVIPYCSESQTGKKQLGLWRLSGFDELEAGTWGILEPPKRRWRDPDKVCSPQSLDLVVVPGVAFAENGARLGNGQGYYDDLLSRVRDDCLLVGVGFQCQMFADVPMAAHDIYLDKIITETGCYQGVGRQR